MPPSLYLMFQRSLLVFKYCYILEALTSSFSGSSELLLYSV